MLDRTIEQPTGAPKPARVSEPPIRRDRQRRRVPLHPLVEAAARVAFAYLRNQHGLRSRRPLPRYLGRTLLFLAAAPFLPLLEARMSGLRVLLRTSDRTIARSVYASGDWDPLLVGAVFEALDLLGRPYRGRTFVEIGANFGVYSLPAVTEFGFARAVAYEPEPASYALLRRNIVLNGLQDRVQAFRAALSHESGELLLSRSAGNAGDNRIVASTGTDARRGDRVAVRASTVDREIEDGVIDLSDVGLVWIDVQGHEVDVLAGARSLLQSDVPVVLEYSTSMMSAHDRRRLDETIAANYRLLVDLGWSALTNRIRFQPSSAVHRLAPPRRAVETDLLLV